MIKYENIGISFNNKKVLSDFNLEIGPGQKVLLKGKSGSGKSTLFKILLGFAKPEEGKVYFQKGPISPEKVREIRKAVAYVSQDPDIGEGRVRTLLEEIFSYRANRNLFDSQKLRSLMEEFELEEDILEKNYEELSGGEKQRVGIIIALLLEREVYLLDEATSALDAGLKQKVADYFLHRRNWTLFIISHDPEWEREDVKIIVLEKLIEGDKCIEDEKSIESGTNIESGKSVESGKNRLRRGF
ncbi:MAG: ABC transporter ATP-binding protein [Methanosarcinaceae archaeon]|nr:ABC transporter ATP-binding protein [Methanosarcinaceae archaeon]